MLVPLYGFLRGDTLGLMILVRADQKVCEVAASLQQAASIRVAPFADPEVYLRGQRLDPELTVAQAGLAPLDRIDVVPGGDR